MSDKLRRRIIEALPITLIGAITICFIVLSAFYAGSCEKKLGSLDEGWTLSGVPVDSLPSREARKAGEPSVLAVTLDDRFDDPMVLCFYSVYEDVHVRVAGEEIYSFTGPDTQLLIDAAPNYWNTVVLPGDSSGSLLEIELCSPYQNYSNIIPQIRVGSLEQINQYVLMETVPRFVAAMAILCIGLVFCISAVVLRFYVEGNNGLYSLSLFFIVLAMFLASQQTTILLGLYGKTSYIFLQHISLMLCPVMYTRYLSRVRTGLARKVASCLYIASVFNFLLIVGLHLLDVRDMPEIMSSTRNLCAIVIIYVFLLEFRRERRFISLVLAGGLCYTMYHYFFTGSITWVMYVGIFGYAYILIQRVIFTVVRAQTKEIRLKAELEASRSEIATIQISSHFLYHTLDSIRALIRTDSDRAYKMTGDFAKYLRYRVDGVERMEETVSFTRELRSIRAYTDIKQAQLGDRFRMRFDVETEDFEILPLTVQPLVENSVIHAMQRRREGGEVRLICRETDTGYHIEVIDNGPGPNAVERIVDEQKKSVAINNVNTRLEFYGIAPLKFETNDLGGMTASFDMPKKIQRKEK